jgi:molybdenum cofactor cytidylyltransferase
MSKASPPDPHRASAVAGILLAAGSSQRFGAGNKLLANVDGRPLIFWVASHLTRSHVHEVVVVTGPDRLEIEQALNDFKLRFVHNPDHQWGMGRSIAVGVASLSPETQGVLICPGDMPEVSPALIDTLIGVFERNGGEAIVYPSLADGSQRNPVLWPRRFYPRLAALDGPAGGKALLAELANEAVAVPVAEGHEFIDIDTAEDLVRYRSGQWAIGSGQ